MNSLPTTAIRSTTATGDDPTRWRLSKEALTERRRRPCVAFCSWIRRYLIVDQPEDELDNRFITEGVVPRMREEKRRRQFIFSTHNANIPVLGDAELILGLTASGDAYNRGNAVIRTEHAGSIDAREVRELVEEILEGGEDAFETRRLKYGF